jgi:hypothetical protein
LYANAFLLLFIPPKEKEMEKMYDNAMQMLLLLSLVVNAMSEAFKFENH